MKKIFSVILIFGIIFQVLPNTVSYAVLNNNEVISDNEAISKVNKIMTTDIIKKGTNSDRYAYWNFYISTDNNPTAYVYRFADALYNQDIIKAIQAASSTQITKSVAKEVISEFMVEYTKKHNEEYKLFVQMDGLLNFINKGDQAYSTLVDMGLMKNNIDKKTVEDIIKNLTPWKEKMELCLNRGEIDETTRAWILEGELYKTTKILQKADIYDRLIFLSDLTSKGSNFINITQDLINKYEELKILKYASNDVVDFLTVLSNTAIDENIKQAAIEAKSNLEKYKNANSLQLLLYATGNTAVGEVSVDIALDKLKNISYDALKSTGIKGCMEATSLFKAIEIGVNSSNVLFNAGDALDQTNKIRAMALISLALSSKVVNEQTKFIMSNSDISKKTQSAYEIIKYLPMLLLSRELGELQYYNMRQAANSGILMKLVNKDTTIDDWYNQTKSELAKNSSLVDDILYNNKLNKTNSGWKQDNIGWWYTEGGSYAVGWRLIDDDWYYFLSDGYMAHDTIIDGYYLNSSGAWSENPYKDEINHQELIKINQETAFNSNDFVVNNIHIGTIDDKNISSIFGEPTNVENNKEDPFEYTKYSYSNAMASFFYNPMANDGDDTTLYEIKLYDKKFKGPRNTSVGQDIYEVISKFKCDSESLKNNVRYLYNDKSKSMYIDQFMGSIKYEGGKIKTVEYRVEYWNWLLQYEVKNDKVTEIKMSRMID